MKLQQLNFFLRDLLDRAKSSQGLSTPLADGSPWDWLPLPQGEVMIYSGANGLHWTLDGMSGRADVGFPSQLDRIDASRISVGSIFSNGAAILSGHSVTRIDHESPIVLVLSRNDKDWAVCYDGTIIDLSDGAVKLRLEIDQVDRVRLIDGHLFASDWSRPGLLLSCALVSSRQQHLPIDPIILLNDICRVEGRYYAICKQQGRVFAFDSSFTCTGERLAFGRGSGRLFDPLTLRHHQGKLHVLSWVTATRVTVPVF